MIIEEMYAEQLAKIIGDYRKGELPIVLDQNHVIKWISQFPKESQCVILEETLHIFKQWFLAQSKSECSFRKCMITYVNVIVIMAKLSS